MSSVQRFIRQIPASTQYYNAASVVGTTGNVYELVPAAGNVVGNYPPGTMSVASTALQTAINAQGAATAVVLRDMGKTVRATLTAAPTQSGFFRQVQLVVPAAITSYIGGSSASSFGVVGVPAPGTDAYTNYLTFYVPIVQLGTSVNMPASMPHGACQQ